MEALNFEPVPCDFREFDRKRQESVGISARFALLLASKTKQELCGLWEAEPEATLHLMEDMSAFSEQMQALGGLAKSVEARLIIAAHEVFDVPFCDDEAEGA